MTGVKFKECNAAGGSFDSDTEGLSTQGSQLISSRLASPPSERVPLFARDAAPGYLHIRDYARRGSTGHIRASLGELELLREKLVRDGNTFEGAALEMRRSLQQKGAWGLSDSHRRVLDYLIRIDQKHIGIVWPRFSTVAHAVQLSRDSVVDACRSLKDRHFLAHMLEESEHHLDAVWINYERTAGHRPRIGE